jgi:hypothetical protein
MPAKATQVVALQKAIGSMTRILDKHALPEDARLARGLIEGLDLCMDRYSKLRGIAEYADKFTVTAVERGYQACPRHSSLARNGIKAGRRDGAYLLEKLVLAASVGGAEAERDLHRYFRNEQVRLSKLPGGVVVEFLRGMQEQLRDFPEIVELVAGLAQVAAAYTSAIKLDQHSSEIAHQISDDTIQASNAYRTAIGETGMEACVRDNSIMIRGLATCLAHSPMDVEAFKVWWKKRIGRHLKAKPAGYQPNSPWGAINQKALVQALTQKFDFIEIDFIEAFLNQVTSSDSHTGKIVAQRGSSSPAASVISGGESPLTFADVTI